MSKYLDPKTDIVFKKIFGNNKKLLKSFLNAVLPLPDDRLIEDLSYLPSEQVPLLPALKHTIVDVKCTDTQQRTFIVEMQIQWVPAFMQRMLVNTSSAYVRQLNKGEAYANLSPVYGLALLGHNLIDVDRDPEWFHHYKMTHTKNSNRSLDDLQIVIVELPKFKPTTIQDKKLTVLWLRFLSEINEKTRQAPTELLAIPEIKEALDLAEESAFTPGELEAYNTYWDAVSTQVTLIEGKMAQAEAVGLAKGEAMGLAKGEAMGEVKGEELAACRIAKKLLQNGMSIELVSEITQLPLSKIKQLQLTHE